MYATINTLATERLVRIPAGPVVLEGNLHIPATARGMIVFAHGSGSSRFSPRNQFVAQALRKRGFATLLFDLLTPDEEAIDERTRQLRFNIDLLAGRLAAATGWLAQQPDMRDLRIGYFGASTGAAAALVAAAAHPDAVGAIVSRGGRPDLADTALAHVCAPTLLIVGGYDIQVLRLNELALAQLHVEKELAVVPRATHLFEEAGALEHVAELAGNWFARYL